MVFVNFEALRLMTPDDVRALAEFLDQRLSALGTRVNGVVNYDNAEVSDDAAADFFAMVRHNSEQYFLSLTRYSTNAFYRRQLREKLTRASLPQQIYPASPTRRTGCPAGQGRNMGVNKTNATCPPHSRRRRWPR